MDLHRSLDLSVQGSPPGMLTVCFPLLLNKLICIPSGSSACQTSRVGKHLIITLAEPLNLALLSAPDRCVTKPSPEGFASIENCLSGDRLGENPRCVLSSANDKNPGLSFVRSPISQHCSSRSGQEGRWIAGYDTHVTAAVESACLIRLQRRLRGPRMDRASPRVWLLARLPLWLPG